jgi:hypothetical protein
MTVSLPESPRHQRSPERPGHDLWLGDSISCFICVRVSKAAGRPTPTSNALSPQNYFGPDNALSPQNYFGPGHALSPQNHSGPGL